MDHHALQNGHILFEYRIDRLLGEGGFGLTYLAFDTNLEKKVAIKEYYPADFAFRKDGNTVVAKSKSTTTDYDWGLQAFLSEAKTLARYSDPNIIQIYRFFEAHGTAYMVMEYCNGGTLQDRVNAASSLTEADVLDILIPIMNGLQLVHDNDVLHRDIKPENIMFRCDGTPVLIDFGAARQAIGAKSRSITTIVSPGYAPIEQYSSKAIVGPASDIYSLAAVGYFCLTGKKPEDATDRIAVDSMERLGDYSGASQFLKSLDQAMSVHAEQRPQTLIDWYEQWQAQDGGAAPANTKAETKLIRNTATLKVAKTKDDKKEAKGPSEPISKGSDNKANDRTNKRNSLPLVVTGVVLFLLAAGGYFAHDYLKNENQNIELVSGSDNEAAGPDERSELNTLASEQPAVNQETDIPDQDLTVEDNVDQEVEAARRQLVTDVQTELLRLGYPIGVADGIAGSQTVQAIEQFQGSTELNVNGQVSEALLSAIRSADQRPAAENDQLSGYLEITNDTGYDIYYLYVSHEDSDSWGEDVLGNEVISTGESFQVELENYSSSIFDVRANDEDGDTYILYDIDVAVQDLTLTIDDIVKDDGDSFSGYIEVTNSTGYDIYYLYVSHEDSDNWEEDVLGDDVLVDGQSFRVNLNDYSSSIFDIRAEDEDEDTYTLYGIDVAAQDLTLTLDNLDQGADTTDSFSGYVEVTNNTGYEIYYLYVSHEDAENWEEDVLGDAVLSNGDAVRIDLNDYPSSVFDIRAKDEDNDTYTVYGLNIATQNLTLTLDNLD